MVSSLFQDIKNLTPSLQHILVFLYSLLSYLMITGFTRCGTFLIGHYYGEALDGKGVVSRGGLDLRRVHLGRIFDIFLAHNALFEGNYS